ncbi:CDP-alcohol phosphatidyltransferase family protein [Vampirovibrio chlorellavorus]|uniref:CDP-alcohol phosphatidyltransferase family protein n=1 Tax=Vampirovibrio chlorellavorus TaxID=758823 RepID=UPI0026EEA808|nr:CDP-alcohol phosphatidyltransferase family protein [Vampirovibrio chlorellavorus]
MSKQAPADPVIKPDLGLYQTKYLLRKVLRTLPGIGKLSPNLLSIAGLGPGLLAAVFLFEGEWLGALLSIAGRMIINTLDGLVAEEFDKKTHIGGYLNRLPGEFTDVLIVLALYPHAPMHWILPLIILTGWVQVFGLLGLAAGGSTQSVGPCGQTDRLAILMLGCLLALFKVNVWPTLVPLMCAGCALTIGLRVYRSIREIYGLDLSAASSQTTGSPQ